MRGNKTKKKKNTKVVFFLISIVVIKILTFSFYSNAGKKKKKKTFVIIYKTSLSRAFNGARATSAPSHILEHPVLMYIVHLTKTFGAH